MKSMTGYGRGDCAREGFKVTVELSSVNRKQAEISVNLPREMEMLEAQMRDLINRHIARGRLTVRVSLHAAAGKASARMHLNLPLAQAYARELWRLARQLKLSGPVSLDHLVRAPGVFQTDEELADAEHLWPAVGASKTAALVKTPTEGGTSPGSWRARGPDAQKCAIRVQTCASAASDTASNSSNASRAPVCRLPAR
jgi:uncharacterized protein (TIGR00255 family)